MGDKETFQQRVVGLGINLSSIREVRVYLPSKVHSIPNAPGKQGSLQVYAAITTSDGYIGADEARRGLEIFGESYRRESHQEPGRHPNIELLEQILRDGQRVKVDVLSWN